MTKHTIRIFFFRELVDQPPHPIDHIQKLAKAVLGSEEANEGKKCFTGFYRNYCLNRLKVHGYLTVLKWIHNWQFFRLKNNFWQPV